MFEPFQGEIDSWKDDFYFCGGMLMFTAVGALVAIVLLVYVLDMKNMVTPLQTKEEK